MPQLGMQDFATREKAEKHILRMGKPALQWLDRLPASEDPEVRFRLARIGKELRLGREWTKAELLLYAADSLLRERNDPKSRKAGGLVFAELFHEESGSLDEGYRGFPFKADDGLVAKVSGGLLRMNGKHRGDGDQRLVFEARKVAGKEDFPDGFQIEVMLGGGSGGAGVYHVGVSVGNVRALFHPGYQGGGFRFERIDTHKPLTENVKMGFTPAADELLLMKIDARRFRNGDVELSVVVTPKGGVPRFTTKTRIDSGVIGKVRSIGLDRSGRSGGDGNFDNLVIRLTGK